MNRFINRFENLTDSKIYKLDDGLRFWQDRILNRILLIACLIGFPVYTGSYILSIRNEDFLLAGAYSLVYLSIIVLMFLKRASYILRASVLIVISYILGFTMLVLLKDSGRGTVWFFFAPVLTAILLGRSISYLTLLLNVLLTSGAGFFLYYTHEAPLGETDFIYKWTIAGIYFIMLNVLTTVSIPPIYHGLQASIRAQKISRMKYLRIFNNILDIYFEISVSGIILEISPSAGEMFGIEFEALIGRSIQDFTCEDADDFIFVVEAEGAVEDFEICVNTLQGVRKTCSVNAKLIKDRTSNRPSIVGIIRDISQSRKIREENRDLEEKLLRSEKMESLGILAGGVAHDLNNILSGIIAYPELMLSDISDDHPYRGYLNAMRESGEKAAAILDDLLSLARRGIVLNDVLDFNTVILKFLDSPECENLKNLYKNTEINTELRAEFSHVTGSSFHLHKLVMNLVSNAIESQTDGGVIRISTYNRFGFEKSYGTYPIPRGDYIIFKLEDEGEGIKDEDLHRIFEPFFTRKIMGRSGTGLGMAVVWGTIQDHSGYINIDSEVGRGTEIEVYLPITEDVHEKKPETWNLEDYNGNGETILVVDDLQEQRDINSMLLEHLNYITLTASSGEEALEILEKVKIDLILMDMIMDPGINGLDAFIKIRESYPEQKVVLISGFSEKISVKRAFESGVNDFLKKPCSLEQLSRSIRIVLGS